MSELFKLLMTEIVIFWIIFFAIQLDNSIIRHLKLDLRKALLTVSFIGVSIVMITILFMIWI